PPTISPSSPALTDLTCTLLLLNPDFTTAWNVRKELVQLGALDPFKDLYLGKLALTKFPKSPETWIHSLLLSGLSSPGVQLFQGEREILLDELSNTKYWVSTHVSDHSGFHYRQFLLKSVAGNSRGPAVANAGAGFSRKPSSKDHCTSLPMHVKQEGASADTHAIDVPLMIEEEMELCTDLIESYPGHEALWSHRRSVFYLWHCWNRDRLQVLSDSSNRSEGTKDNVQMATAGSYSARGIDGDAVADRAKQGYTQDIKRLKRGPSLDLHSLLEEHRFIDAILAGCTNLEQARFATAYRKWLDMVIGQ
ncbi:hypothetical protein scyTo_0017887, partial [Scyliorhinus torazame]|nr:hypothetical protein [Scyliorhinus torazame]